MGSYKFNGPFKINNKYNGLSLEGGRGTGKTSVSNLVLELLLKHDNRIVTNRTKVDQSKYTNLTIINNQIKTGDNFKEIVKIHNEWEKNFSNYECSKLEGMALDILMRNVQDIKDEKVLFNGYDKSDSFFFLDRDLDTTVAYSLAEVFISNPGKYLHNDFKNDYANLLINETCRNIYNARNPQDLTVYLYSNCSEDTLLRSWNSKKSTEESYEITETQKRVQEIIDYLYRKCFEYRIKNHLGADIKFISVDGNSPHEVAEIILRFICSHEISIEGNTPVKLRTWVESKVTDLDSLIKTIDESTTGSAFPSVEEVINNNMSNCVYSNAALVEYANKLNYGKFYFVAVENEIKSNTCPVHWVTFQYFENEKEGRVIDVTPFYKTRIGNRNKVIFENNKITFKEYTPKTLYNILTIDSEERVCKIMELAHDAHYSSNNSDLSRVIKTFESLLDENYNESSNVFISIRLSRTYEKIGNMDASLKIVERAIEVYKNNLVLIREIARLILIGKRLGIKPEFLESLKTGRIIINDTVGFMKSNGYSNSEIEEFKDYYKWMSEIDIK